MATTSQRVRQSWEPGRKRTIKWTAEGVRKGESPEYFTTRRAASVPGGMQVSRKGYGLKAVKQGGNADKSLFVLDKEDSLSGIIFLVNTRRFFL